MLSSLPASRADASCRASPADFDSCADVAAGSASIATAIVTTAHPRRATCSMAPSREVNTGLMGLFYHPHWLSSTVGRRRVGGRALKKKKCAKLRSGRRSDGASDEERVLVLGGRPARPAVAAQLADGVERRQQTAHDGAAFAERRAQRGLDGVERQVDAADYVGKQLIGALHLRRGERRRARRVAA